MQISEAKHVFMVFLEGISELNEDVCHVQYCQFRDMRKLFNLARTPRAYCICHDRSKRGGGMSTHFAVVIFFLF